MPEVYAGLDVHRKKTVYVIQDADGDVIAEGTVPTHREGIQQMIVRHSTGARNEGVPGMRAC